MNDGTPKRRERATLSSGEALVEALYTLSDINAEVLGLRAHAVDVLHGQDDMGLVDDVIDALLDPAQSEVARPILRDALARIARHALRGSGGA